MTSRLAGRLLALMSVSSRFTAPTRIVMLGLTLAIAAQSVGCKALDYVPARHKLNDTSTAILVDDPANLMRTPMGESMIAEQIRRDVLDQAKIEDVIPTRRIETLRGQLGDAYATTPVDVVGEKLGVSQVVHVLVEDVQWNVQDLLTRPTAAVRVRVINVDEGRRVFPAGDTRMPSSDPGRLFIEFPQPMRYEPEDRGKGALVQRELARQIGRHIGRLFYRWHIRDKI